MATTNYNLPTISGSSPVAIVDDYNGLANATDAAIAGAISTEKTRAMAAETELANGVSNALSTANNASVSATAANTAAEKAQTTANNAATAATAAQSTADAATAAATALQQALSDAFNFSVVGTLDDESNKTIHLTVAANKAQTLYKVYGVLRFTAYQGITRVSIPGGSSSTYTHGVKIDCGGIFKTSAAYTVNSGGFLYYGNDANAQGSGICYPKTSDFVVGTDGNIYVMPANSADVLVGAGLVRVYTYPSCIYVNAPFGDSPYPEPSE